MIRNYLITALRVFRRHKFYALLNIVGLGIGLATCLLILLYVRDELSYDRYNAHAGRIYRINNEVKFGGTHVDVAQTPPLLGPEAVKQLPGVLQYTRFRWRDGFLVKKGNGNLRENRVAYADSTLFDIFTLPMMSGSPSTALSKPRSMVITETMARKYFDRTDVAGRVLVVNDTINYTVTGVIKDIPSNSHFHFDFFLPFAENSRSRDDDWLSENFSTYILLSNNADARRIERQVDELLGLFVAPELKSVIGMDMAEFGRQGNFVRCTLTPLTDIHLHSNRIAELDANGSIQYVYIFSLIAVFILIIACVNFMNMATARSSNRAREVGVRKVLGSARRMLVEQFLAESVLTAFIALLLALAVAWIALPFFNRLSGKTTGMATLLQPGLLLFMLGGTLVVGLLAGLYPAFLLSAFRPVEVLKGKVAKGFRGVWLRNALVVFQFAISITLIIGTLVIYRQLDYMRRKDIGYDRQQVMVIHNTGANKSQMSTLRSDLLQLSGVRDATMTAYLPVDGERNSEAYFVSPTLDPATAISMQSWPVDEHYIPTLGIRLKEGRNFSTQLATDSNAMILNEAAAGFFGDKGKLNGQLYHIEDIKTKQVTAYHIIGIVKNFHFSSLRDAVTPLGLSLGNSRSSMALRLNVADISAVIAQARSRWQAVAPGLPFDYSFLDESFNHQYDAEQRTGQIFIAFATLAILIASLGLFALVAFAADQRIREIGIRKVLGASVPNIVRLLSADFLKLVLVAVLLSFPIAWWLMNRWLQGFAYRIHIGWSVFAAAGVAALLVAVCTVSFQTIKAALANPAESLRAE